MIVGFPSKANIILQGRNKMRKSRKGKKKKWGIPSKFIQPVDPDRFEFGTIAAAAAGASRLVNPPDPSKTLIVVQDDKGDEQFKFRFANIPFNQAMMVLNDSFPEHEEFMSAALRFFALGDVIRNARFKRWIKEDKNSKTALMIHEGLLKAAAKCPLTPEGNFDFDALEKLAKEITREVNKQERAKKREKRKSK